MIQELQISLVPEGFRGSGNFGIAQVMAGSWKMPTCFADVGPQEFRV